METAPAGEAEDRAADGAAGSLHLGLRGLQVGREQHHQGRGRAILRIGVKAAVDAAVVESRVGGAVVGEGPAEGRGVEALGGGKVVAWELDVVDLAVFAHGILLSVCAT